MPRLVFAVAAVTVLLHDRCAALISSTGSEHVRAHTEREEDSVQQTCEF